MPSIGQGGGRRNLKGHLMERYGPVLRIGSPAFMEKPVGMDQPLGMMVYRRIEGWK